MSTHAPEPFPSHAAFSVDEMGERAAPGAAVRCPTCGGAHPIVGNAAADGTPGVLGTYSCGEGTYLAAIMGRLLPGVELAAP